MAHAGLDQGIYKGKSNVLQNEKQIEIMHGYSIHEISHFIEYKPLISEEWT